MLLKKLSDLIIKFVFVLLFSSSLFAQNTNLNKQKGLPLKAERKVEFTTNEGTWLSLDISPDGKTIIFDLLGDFYSLPIEGGTAKALWKGKPTK